MFLSLSQVAETTRGWEPRDFISIAAIGASVALAWWSHFHDRRVRERDYEEQRRLRDEVRQEERNRRAEERNQEWIVRIQQLCADTRIALLAELSLENLSSEEDPLAVIRRIVDFDLRGRFSLIYNFAPDERLRDATRDASHKLLLYLNPAGVVARQSPNHPQYTISADRAQRAYGEAHYALDELVHAAGGPEPASRDGYFFTLDTDVRGDDVARKPPDDQGKH